MKNYPVSLWMFYAQVDQSPNAPVPLELSIFFVVRHPSLHICLLGIFKMDSQWGEQRMKHPLPSH